MGFKSLIFYTF